MTKGPLEIFKGTYDKDSITTRNSLLANSVLHPEIASEMLMLYPQYSLTHITAPFIQAQAKGIGDKKFEYPVMGRVDRPLTLTGRAPVGDAAGDNVIYLEVEEDFAHPTWEYKLGVSNKLLRVHDYGQKTVNGYLVPFKLMTNDNTDTISSSEITQGKRMGKVANSNVEYSEKGYGAQAFPDWIANWTTISRAAKHITGDAASSILWVKKGMQKMWMIGTSPDQWEQDFAGQDGGFLWELEKDAWFGTTTMTAAGICTKTDREGKQIIRGSGFLQQISSTMTDEFSKGSLTKDKLLSFIRDFKITAGINGGKITVHTGAGGVAEWYRFLSNDYLDNGGTRGILYTMGSNREVVVGEDIKTFHILGCDITVFENPVLTDPLNNETDEEGLSLIGQSYFFVDGNTRTGEEGETIPTVQRMVKKGNGYDRRMICRIVDGMMNPIDQSKIFSANARDGWSVEWLSEGMTVLRKINGVAAYMCVG